MKNRIKDMINNEILSLQQYGHEMEIERSGDEYWLYYLGYYPDNRLYLYTYYNTDDLITGIDFWENAGRVKIDEKIEINGLSNLF